MAISQFDKDVEVIQKLDDEPNDVQGLTPAELKKRFDQAAIWLKEYINSTLIPAITGDGASGGGASNIGASVDDFPGNTVQDVLDAFNDALIARYTKAETNAYVGQETNDLVASVRVNLDTGVIIVTKKDGTKDTFDTALEKVPATMALVDGGGKTYLVITNQDGSQTRTDVSKLIDTYTFVNSSEVSFSLGGSGNNRTVTASIRPNSIGPDRFTLEVTQALEQYNAESAASAEAAAASEQAAKTSEINAKKSETASKESADTAIQKSSEAERSAENANLSAGSAAESANVAQRNAGEALGAKNAAIQAQKSIENMQVSANTLPAGTDATVTKTVEDGTVKLNFGLPQGADGSAIAADGLWGVRVDENGDLILTYTGDDIPPLSINEDGDLIYTLDGNEVNLGHVVGGDGGGGTTDYNLLLNKPSINGIPLQGNLTTEGLGIRDGQDGAPGADGATGPEGPPGQAATIEIVETETVVPGTPAAMVELPESTPQARRYKAQVPQGIQGPAGTGLPALSGPEDAGKVPTVNGDGTGYVLWNMESEKNWTMLSDFSIAQPEDTALFKFDGIIAKEFVIFFYGVLNNVDHDAPSATGLVDIKLNGNPYGRFSAYIRAAGGYDSIVKMYRVGNYNFFERSTLEGPGWGQYKTVERGYPFTVGEDINTIELIPENSMVFLAGAKIGLWYK